MTYYTQKMLSSSPKLSPTPHLRKLSLTGFPNGTAFKNNQIDWVTMKRLLLYINGS